MTNISINDYIQIFDKKSNQLIANGKVIAVKINESMNLYCVSIDNNYFFNNNSSNFKFKKIDEMVETKYYKSLKKYKINLWKYHVKKYDNVDIFYDYNIHELDKEVVELVKALNGLPDISTQGSCSGHNREPLWVSINFETIASIIKLAKIINRYFNDDFVLSTRNNIIQSGQDHIVLCLISNHIGKKAYENALKLAEILNYLA